MFRTAFAAALMLGATIAQAATVQVISGTRGGTLSYVDPIGQSFTAVDSALTSFGFQFQSLNPSNPNNPITFTLRAGEGLTGAVLSTRTFTLPTSINKSTPTWYDFDVTGTLLSVGAKYTAVLTTGASFRNAITFGPNLNIFTGQPLTPDAYLGGKLIATIDPDANNYCRNNGTCDLSFRMTGVTAPVPEPGEWAMMAAGLGVVGMVARRRRRAVTA